MPGFVLGPGIMAVNKTDRNHGPMELTFQWGRGEEKQKLNTCLKNSERWQVLLKQIKQGRNSLPEGGRVVMSAGWSGEPCGEGEL